MTQTVPADTRLRGLAMAVSAQGRFAAATFRGSSILSRVHGGPGEVRQVADFADTFPIVTDAPQRVRELLASARVHNAVTWDVLELATMLVPACPRDSLERAAQFFDISVESSGLNRQLE